MRPYRFALAILAITICLVACESPLERQVTIPDEGQMGTARELLLDSNAIFTDSAAIPVEQMHVVGIRTTSGDVCIWVMPSGGKGMNLPLKEYQHLTYVKLAVPPTVRRKYEEAIEVLKERLERK